MVILKKIKSATLVEVLVASVIILVVFVIGSLSLNNVFITGIKGNDSLMQSRINELSYMLHHDKIALPHYEETEAYDISIIRMEGNIIIESLHKPTNKKASHIIYE